MTRTTPELAFPSPSFRGSNHVYTLSSHVYRTVWAMAVRLYVIVPNKSRPPPVGPLPALRPSGWPSQRGYFCITPVGGRLDTAYDLEVYSGTRGWVGFHTLTTEPNPIEGPE
ncbi:hypothetical protein AVEN_201446-1 [Araneus ventricosus]|uniref:Uncharacterized protein n=1 Tax=Araneus ventricosus TaxID=182803 RepID=A0A4Y2JX13_ARAVE|nr:hypothetical protein AVEN_201446-1 [Araneus ventricosus]